MSKAGYSTHTHLPGHANQWTRRLPSPAATLTIIFSLVLAVAYISPSAIYEGPLGSEDVSHVFHDGLHQCAHLSNRPQGHHDKDRNNPRWDANLGQQNSIILRNATLFDGERFLSGPVDITLKRGLTKSVKSSDPVVSNLSEGTEVVDLHGRHVTPGLVDMHSHHLLWPFHSLPAVRDVNETPLLGPLTPFVRSIDGFKPYDPAIQIIAGGGVTSSLILPGSANIMGGEAYVVKNAYLSGANHEPIVEDLLLDYGIPEHQRQRYAKMACGENPKHTYLHTRLGNTWLLREHFGKARDLLRRQDDWCRRATSMASPAKAYNFVQEVGSLPDDLKYKSTIAMLRGQVNINIHCYEPEDLERMLVVLDEFGIRPRAFHHALEAWQVPGLLRQRAPNITIATFAENAFYKAEAYSANLHAGKILSEHGVPVAFKSDHTGEGNNAQYLLHQAAVAYSFGMPADKALQAVTSVPARSIQQDHRIGFVRPGYDADLVVWDDHPLAIGATALQVYIDGKATLDIDHTEFVQSSNDVDTKRKPLQRPSVSRQDRNKICSDIEAKTSRLVLTGVNHIDLINESDLDETERNLTVVIEHGDITCVSNTGACASAAQDGHIIPLKMGHVTPGLTAVSQTLGLVEISGEPSTSDGVVDTNSNEQNVVYAKYGIHLDGKAFTRARLGGITRGVVAPILHSGLLQGVSVGFLTSGKKTILDGGIFQEDVALHFELSEASKGFTPTISGSIGRLRKLLSTVDDDRVFALAATGQIPVVVHAVDTDIIRHLIALKLSLPKLNLIIFGGHGTPHVASQLAAANISVILTANRGAPDTWAKRDALSGPPLTPSPAQILTDAGVLFALAIQGDLHIHNLASEAGWAAKYAGLGRREALSLVSRNVERILGLERETGFVVWEGDPLRGEGSVVVSFEGDGGVGSCWPDE